MSANEHHHPNYTAVWIVLMVLMLASVGVSQAGLSHTVTTGLIYGLSLLKAVIVGLYFMHLKFDHRAVPIMVVTGLVLAVILLLLLLPDFVTAPVGAI